MADTIPMIAPNMKAIFVFLGPERSRDIFKLRGIFISCVHLNLEEATDFSQVDKLYETKLRSYLEIVSTSGH